ncbi:hypothetical protein KNU96_gp64 [Xanthomonas phage FoX5]|uniref:Uncharacterized protein n=1 Tax=Xanthomonas phage FoX5 TaxID=2723901 RepID=A0A858NQS5_9CAUD|nr:hypothetical protein KNU96_gp64 [Xanthomonas phage FoX5]QJB22026.1 hypothetical protein XccvBFoX5_gp48 [Xanthomonas phage FoX5]
MLPVPRQRRARLPGRGEAVQNSVPDYCQHESW